jgi:hypothetical protein
MPNRTEADRSAPPTVAVPAQRRAPAVPAQRRAPAAETDSPLDRLVRKIDSHIERSARIRWHESGHYSAEHADPDGT